MSDYLCSIGEMANRLGVAIVTLRRWEREGRLLPASRTLGGHRRYAAPDQREPMAPITILYARVSSHDQKPDLERQKQRLIAFAEGKGWVDTEAITDLGSGMNFRKRGLIRLLGLILNRRMTRLVLENKDQVCASAQTW